MNILITNVWLQQLGGSETWCLTMTQALRALGYRVFVMSNQHGRMSEAIVASGGHIYTSESPKQYGLILSNHTDHITQLSEVEGPLVNIVHSKFVDLELPTKRKDAVRVAVSGELADHFGIPNVIWNPVNTDLMWDDPELSEPGVALCLCHGGSARNRVLEELSGWEVFYHSKVAAPLPQRDLYAAIHRAQVVIGVGRGIYEAVCAATPCVVYDERHYDSSRGAYPLTTENFEEALHYNFTTRAPLEKMPLSECVDRAQLLDVSDFDYIDIAKQFLLLRRSVCT